MIIELQNFGPIKSFKFDTDKDIHAIFGKNNIGKSYAISAVYLILKGLKNINNYKFDLVFSPNTLLLRTAQMEEIEALVEQNRPININTYFKESLLNFLNTTFIQSLNNSFQNTFNTHYLGNNIDRPLNIKIFVGDINLEIIFLKEVNRFSINDVTFTSYVSVMTTNRGNRQIVHIKDNVTLRTLIFDKQYDLSKEILYSCLRSFEKINNKTVENIYYLPAARSGLYNALNSFGAIFAELARSRNFLTSKIEIPSISEPISDYFLNLNNIEDSVISATYLEYFEEIEKDILKGTIGFDKTNKKYYYIPDSKPDMKFDLSATSSMISEIAPIIAHLKYIIPLQNETPSMLFIEEPEAHLHPEIQILLLEYFVKLSKGNLKIVMTSHSNYIFNKLSNMVISKEISPDRLSVSLMKMTPEGSVIEEGAMHMDEYGIEDDNFVDVAEQLYEERMKLLENINE